MVQTGLDKLSDTSALDFAFIFKLPECKSGVALWAHQFILAMVSVEFKNQHRLAKDFSTMPPRLFHIRAVEIQEYPLFAYCALLRFIYTGQVQLDIDLREYCITPKAYYPEQKQQGDRSKAVAGLMHQPLRKALWSDLYDLAVKYGMKDLQALCDRPIADSQG